MRLTLANALEGTGVSLAEIRRSPLPHFEFPEIMRKLEVLRLIPKGSETLHTAIKGTSFAKEDDLQTLHDAHHRGELIDWQLVPEPDNPKSRHAIRVFGNGHHVGYLPDEVAKSLGAYRYQCAGILEFHRVPSELARMKHAFEIVILIGYVKN